MGCQQPELHHGKLQCWKLHFTKWNMPQLFNREIFFKHEPTLLRAVEELPILDIFRYKEQHGVQQS